MPRYTIDRFEGEEWAVLEDDQARTFRFPRGRLPADAHEGDVLNASAELTEPTSQSVDVELDPAARQDRMDRAARRRAQLPRGPKGDIAL
jgi:hypothetical protein